MTSPTAAVLDPSHGDNRFDVLRLVAAWLVLFSHSYPLSGGTLPDPLVRTTGLDTLGGVGVVVFFVLSGYLVAQSMERSGNVLDFLWRRAVRIYPALLMVCAFCVFAVGTAFTTLPRQVYLDSQWTYPYFWTATAWDIRYGLPDVFVTHPVAHIVNGSLWSLPLEITCYLALAVLSLVPGPLRYKAPAVLAVLLGLMLTQTVVVGSTATVLGMDFLLVKLAVPFALGASLAAWRDRLQPRLGVGAALVLLAWALPASPWRTGCFLVGLSIAVLALALHARWLPRIPARMGDWSYGMYLYGFPVQQSLVAMGLHEGGFAVFVLLSTAFTAVLAALSWHAVEKPAMKLKHLPRQAVRAAVRLLRSRPSASP